ncbi:dentin sialophosphoprotein-like isoform X2 [Pecten maximus]|uniref:dentin sialophosphoprotein-like isoform X2 n=1 Tax=Pecten maximus TaxID=6579 RepID=UPI001458B84D|nr:dentin sialophosphoprotein-like isoform X2 [Pecten maximus]
MLLIRCLHLFTYSIDATNTTGRAGNLVNDGILKRHFNCKMKKIVLNGEVHLALFATRQISPGDKLLYDYGEDSLWWRKSCENDVNLETSDSDVPTKTESMDRMPSDTCNDSDVSTVYDELETQGNDIDGCRRLPDADLPANSSDKTKDSDVPTKTESMDRTQSDNYSDGSEDCDEMETQGNDTDGCRRLPDADLPANSSDKTKDSDSDVQSKTESMDRMPSDTCNNSDVSTVYDELETQGNDTDVTPVSHGMNGQRVYDKRQACYYCGQLFA